MAVIDTVRAAFPAAQRIADRRIELIVVRAFMSADECAAVTALIDADVRPSTVIGDTTDPGFRTSETCDLFPGTDVVRAIDARIAATLGLDPAHGETMQGQRYRPGQEFKAHTDFFDLGGPDYDLHCAKSGQRTWTAMVYLNVPQAGGATRFKTIAKSFTPEVGKLIAWNNRLKDGQVNGATLHAGLPVRAGAKYVITKWYRERPV